MSEGERYSRQERLSEVGALGQDRILRSSAEIRGKDGATIEIAYLERAGVSSLALLPQAQPEPFDHAEWFEFDAARSVGAGAWRALQKLRRVLRIEAS